MENNNKVVPIFGDGESEKDKKMDGKMTKRFVEEFDKEEERLLNDPALKDVTAPDDMFGKIMGELRAQGKLRKEDMVVETKRPEIQNAVDGLSDEDKEALLLGRMVKASGADADDIRRALENPMDKRSGAERKRRKSRKNRKKSIGSGGRAKVIVRNLAIGVASFAILVGGSMSTSAGREYISSIVVVVTEKLNGDGILIVKDSNENGEIVSPEELAYKDVLNTIGVNPLYFIYLPEELTFFNYDIQEGDNSAVLRYGEDERKMTVVVEKRIEEIELYAMVDGLEIKRMNSMLNDLSIIVYELNNLDNGLKVYTAYFTYEDNFYMIRINGDLDTFVLILEAMEIKIS